VVANVVVVVVKQKHYP